MSAHLSCGLKASGRCTVINKNCYGLPDLVRVKVQSRTHTGEGEGGRGHKKGSAMMQTEVGKSGVVQNITKNPTRRKGREEKWLKQVEVRSAYHWTTASSKIASRQLKLNVRLSRD